MSEFRIPYEGAWGSEADVHDIVFTPHRPFPGGSEQEGNPTMLTVRFPVSWGKEVSFHLPRSLFSDEILVNLAPVGTVA